MSANLATIYTDGTYARKNQSMGDDNAAWKAANVMAMLKRANLTPQTILEVGCGAGAILVELKKQLPENVTFKGFEPMPEAYARACNRSDSRLSFEQTSVRHTSPEVFDLVLCLDVFEHVEDYFTFLRDLRNYGKNFIFHIPLDMNAQMVARGSPIIKVRERVGHLHYFSKYTALASLEYCGYHILLDFYTKSWESQYGGLAFKLFGLIRALGLKVAPDLSSRLLGGMPLMVLAEGMATSGEGTGE